ncbi:flagellar hook-length control protein FliK [Fertoebacter nigrum]|uniref:Flagellar hook-length control protein FliK n=1 Tax=Fertoeibacter niger TaxID=2656921 RepID=A0A8X8H7P6_9RHOB|nr:flagellar hook-length control protein FliK [Fertoeibacter niger]
MLAETARVLSDATVELALAPEELGRLRMTVSTDGDAIRVTLHAERPETLDLLRRHADDLRQEFRQAGFGFTSFRFGEWEGTPATEPAPAPEETEPPPLPPAADAARASPASGLDLRL